MVGYPIAWDRRDQTGNTYAGDCPYSAEEMGSYLYSNHFYWSLDEPPMMFGEPKLVTERADEQRKVWLWRTRDQLDRDWWLVVGTGQSPSIRT